MRNKLILVTPEMEISKYKIPDMNDIDGFIADLLGTKEDDFFIVNSDGQFNGMTVLIASSLHPADETRNKLGNKFNIMHLFKGPIVLALADNNGFLRGMDYKEMAVIEELLFAYRAKLGYMGDSSSRKEGDHIEISAFTLSDNIVNAAFTEDMISKTITDSCPHADFINAMDALYNIFSLHMELTPIEKRRIGVIGVEEKDSKDFGTCYKLLGTLECNGKEYKLATVNLVPRPDEFFEEREYDECLWAINDYELSLIMDAFKECMLFVKGKRKPSEQPEFDFGGQDG